MTGVRIAPDPPVPQRWTVLSLIEWASAFLAARSFDESRLHVELMLGHVLSLKRIQLYLQFDRPLTASELAAFKVLFTQRLEHVPLQYILGETEFMGVTLSVAPGVLIPRSETELLVETALKHAKASGKESMHVLDVGTGSGCIALGMAHELPAVAVLGIDNSEEALVIARKNHERYPGLRVAFERHDIRTASWPGGSFDFVLSNPPYIAPGEYETLEPEVRDHEPRAALTDEQDGLAYYRVLLSLAPRVLRPGGLLICEVGHGQADAVASLAQTSGVHVVEIVPDLAGIPRVVVGVPFTYQTEG
jgi:release factor glutamine methyltransferase